MAAVITIPARSPHHAPRPAPAPARPPLTVLPGGRRAARQHAISRRPAHRLHPAVYRRRRLGLAVAAVTVVVVGYLALTGLRVLTAEAGAGPSSASAPASAVVGAGAAGAGATYVVHSGDTLWSIARTLQPSGDVRDLVDRLADRVGPGPLQAGQSLRIDGLVP